jgi:hypothetical protein
MVDDGTIEKVGDKRYTYYVLNQEQRIAGTGEGGMK